MLYVCYMFTMFATHILKVSTSSSGSRTNLKSTVMERPREMHPSSLASDMPTSLSLQEGYVAPRQGHYCCHR